MQNTGGGMPAGPSPAAPTPPSVYGQQHGQQQLLVPPQQQYQQRQPQLHPQQLQQLASNSPASTAATGTATTNKILINGGRFDFDDGGTYCGGWEDGKAHGHGVCTGPKGQGAYSGSWHYGFEVSGVYMWPSGNTFEGQWQNGKRHGLGVESRGRWLYRGEWTQGFKGRYGVRQSATTNAKYEGTWANGLQDGYGSETYADGGTFQGQWMRGMRHGYGVRTSAKFGMASHSKPGKSDGIRNSLSSLGSEDLHHNKAGSGSDDQAIVSEGRDKKLDDTRGGFVLKANSDEQPSRRKTLVSKSTQGLKRTFMSGFRMRKQRSTGELEKKMSGSIRSTASCTSWISTGSSQSAMGESYNTDSNASFIVEDEHMDVNTTETYVGEWKNDKRSGFGVAERTDGLKYEGEWFGNKKYGYGVTTFKDGTKEEGKYKNNVLITSQKKRHLFLIRSAKLKERVDAAVNAAHRASKIALQKADIAISRMATARGKAELSDIASDHAREDHDIAKETAKQFAPDFVQPGLEKGRPKIKSALKQTPAQKPVPAAPDPVPLPKATVSHVGGSAQSQYDSKEPTETTAQFIPQSKYATQYYHTTASDQYPYQTTQQKQQQTPAPGYGIGQQQARSSNVRSSFSRNSLTPSDPTNKVPASTSVQFHNGWAQELGDEPRLVPPPLPPNRVINSSSSSSDPYVSANSGTSQHSNTAYRARAESTAGAQPESGAQAYNRQYSTNGAGDAGDSNATSGRQSRQADRLSRGSPSTARNTYYGNEEDYNQDRNGRTSVQSRDQSRERIGRTGVQFSDEVQERAQNRDDTNRNSSAAQYRDDPKRNGSAAQYRDDPKRNGSVPQYHDEIDRNGDGNQYRDDRSRNGGKQYSDLQRRESVHRGERRDSQRRDTGTDYSRFRETEDPEQSRLRRNANYVNRDSGQSEHQQQYSSNDHHEHYNRPPSRDNSVDRYQRTYKRLSDSSRQGSVERSSNQHLQQPDGRSPFGSTVGGQSPRANASGSVSYTVPKTSRQSPFEDVIIKQRNIGQEIVPSPSGFPKRTESLYVNPVAVRREHQLKEVPVLVGLQRKKSLPDVQAPSNAPASITREEVSVLSSARREEMRRVEEENERLRANPLLYLTSPHMKDWFTRQQLVLVILVVNISLALMFFKLLTS